MSTIDTIRAALYQRVSTEDQDADRQNKANREVAAREGWQATEFEDKISASRFGNGKARPDYEAMLAGIDAGQFGVLVIWEASRGSRELEQWAHLLNACRRAGCLIHVTSHHRTYDMAEGRDWRTLAEDGTDSAYESEKISLRVTAGKAEGREAGRPQGAVAYGVRRIWDPALARRRFIRDEPDPVTGPVAARIVRAVARGDSYHGIAAALEAEGVPTPAVAMSHQREIHRGAWARSTITRIAANPVYASVGLVTDDESLAARARLADVRRKGERPSAQTYRYSHALGCAACGAVVRGGRGRYICTAGCVSVPARLADAWIDRLAIGKLSDPRAAYLFAPDDRSAADAARAEADRYRTRLDEAAASYAAGKITVAQMEAVSSALVPKCEAADRRAAEAELPSALAGLPDDDPAIVAARWDGLAIGARKAALRALAPAARPSASASSCGPYQAVCPAL
jgi:site-specific DNA recombinase